MPSLLALPFTHKVPIGKAVSLPTDEQRSSGWRGKAHVTGSAHPCSADDEGSVEATGVRPTAYVCRRA